jgi:hypothetical protein
MDERAARQARNEGLVRLVNERIDVLDKEAEHAGWPPADHRYSFHCECGRDDGCSAKVAMTLDEYDRVRAEDDRFVVAPGHENAEIECVVERDDRFVIVDKVAELEPLVDDDARGAPSE